MRSETKLFVARRYASRAWNIFLLQKHKYGLKNKSVHFFRKNVCMLLYFYPRHLKKIYDTSRPLYILIFAGNDPGFYYIFTFRHHWQFW